MPAIDNDEIKEQFAEKLLLYPDDPFKAALQVFPHDTAQALVVSREWPVDPVVVNFIECVPEEELAEMGVPTKNDLAREAWKRVQKTFDHEIAFKGIETIRKLMYPDQTGPLVQNNTLVDNRRVMVVKDHGTDDEWETQLIAQQTALTNEAS